MKTFLDTITLGRKIRLGWAAATSGFNGVIGLMVEYFGGWFNDSKLAEQLGSEDAKMYIADVKDFAAFLTSVTTRHEESMSSVARMRFHNVVEAVNLLIESLEDAKLSVDEINDVIKSVKKAFDDWDKV